MLLWAQWLCRNGIVRNRLASGLQRLRDGAPVEIREAAGAGGKP
jgi:hypothetical protein